MDERRITSEEFDKAIVKATENIRGKIDPHGMAAFLVPMTGTMFAIEMKSILFPKEETADNEEIAVVKNPENRWKEW